MSIKRRSKFLVFAVAMSIIILFVVIRIRKIYENPLENIQGETEEIPSYVIYGTLHSKYGEVSIYHMCKEENEDYYLEEVLCVKDENVFFVYSAPNDKGNYWAIASINLITSEFQTHCKMDIPKENYGYAEFINDYKDQNGFYYNDQIILSDHTNVLSYDLESRLSKVYHYDEYIFPKHVIRGKYVDNETIELLKGGKSYRYNLQTMSQKSVSIAEIMELKQKKIWSGDSYLENMFSEFSPQVVNEKVYIIGQCRNYRGYAYAMIFEYDLKMDLWKYVTSTRSAAGDIVHGRCYVIPQL